MFMKEKYELLQQKYELPSYDEMVLNFEIDSVGKDEIIIREVLKKMFDKVDFYTRTAEGLLQPDSTLGNMKEASGMSRQDIFLINKIFVEGMYLTRMFTEFTLEYSEEEGAEFVKKIWIEWQKLKPDIKIMLTKLKDVWKKEYISEIDKGYIG